MGDLLPRRRLVRRRLHLVAGMNRSMMSVDDVAGEMNVSASTVRRWIAQGELVATDLGSMYRIDPDDFDAFKKARKTGGQS